MERVSFLPVEDRILVKAFGAQEKKTKSGLILPETVELPRRGVVVGAGPGKLLDSGECAPMYIHVGDEVIYGKFSGADIDTESGVFACMKQSDVFCVVQRYEGYEGEESEPSET